DLYGHPELETIRKAYTGLPASVQVMSKYCPLDFYGGAIADEPLIGAFPNEHLVEFSLDVEWQGRTFVPVLTPANFQRRIAHALDKKCIGIVARVDFPFPSMEPAPIFGHPTNSMRGIWASCSGNRIGILTPRFGTGRDFATAGRQPMYWQARCVRQRLSRKRPSSAKGRFWSTITT